MANIQTIRASVVDGMVSGFVSRFSKKHQHLQIKQAKRLTPMLLALILALNLKNVFLDADLRKFAQIPPLI